MRFLNPVVSTKPITDEAANEEHVPIHSNDPLLSGEDRLKLNELLELCTKLSERVLELENTKTSQATEITKLKERVKKLDRRNKSRTPGLKRLRKVSRTTRIESSKDKEEEKRPARQKEEEDNLISWDNTQAMMEADYELAQRLQAEEQGELTIEERSILFIELMDKRKKHFANLRAEEIRRKPPTKAQKRNKMLWKEVKARQKEVLREQEKNLTIDAIPLATKSPIIVDWKVIKEGKMGYFQIIRDDGSSRRYSSMIRLLQNIDREDLETLWKLVKAKHGNTRPEEAYERVL
ncbi:hypothetical protein Tco_0786110 [Tanacetum coccineum]